MNDDVKVLVHLLCEGYHDRSFWKGALEHLGFKKETIIRGKNIQGGGQYGFKKGNVGVIVKPCNGGAITKALKRELESLDFDRLIYNVDSDKESFSASEAAQTCKTAMTMNNLVFREAEDHLVFEAEKKHRALTWFVWGTQESGGTHVPIQQTLERLVCKALIDAFPERGPVVDAFLTPAATLALQEPKSFTWAHMAKWYPLDECSYFFEHLWKTESVREALIRFLGETRIWPTLQNFLSPGELAR